MSNSSRSVGVIGAGISALICAKTLATGGWKVKLFEKSRGVGGRMATRRTSGPQFDHGAQYFTVRDPRFKEQVECWLTSGVASVWKGRICDLNNGQVDWKERNQTRLAGVPGMNAICKAMAADLEVEFNCRVEALVRTGRGWSLSSEDQRELGQFDRVIVSAPAPQTVELLHEVPGLQSQAAKARMQGCWAAMLAFDQRLDLPFDGAFVHDSPLSWVARNSSKPGRASEPETWVVHASPEWTEERIDEQPSDILPAMLDAFWAATQIPTVTPEHSVCHRWRYAIPPEPLETSYLYDPNLGIGACGDWCGGPRVEGAFLSGLSLAEAMLGTGDFS